MRKVCKVCGEEKAISEFPLCRGKPRARCKPCHVRDAVAWQQKNREKRLAITRRYEDKIRAAKFTLPKLLPDVVADIKRHKSAEWRAANAEAFGAMRKSWAARNKDRIAANCREYQAARYNARPRWVKRSDLIPFYSEAAKLRAETGEAWEVDHIVPLRSPLVCGLHCPANLRVVRMAENRSKHNRIWPGMP